MDTKIFFTYLIIMAGVTYLVRAIPLVAFRRKVENKFIKSFLYYMPYAVLGCMTFPAILYSTGDLISGAAGAAVGLIFAIKGKGLLFVATAACIAVFLVKLCAG